MFYILGVVDVGEEDEGVLLVGPVGAGLVVRVGGEVGLVVVCWVRVVLPLLPITMARTNSVTKKAAPSIMHRKSVHFLSLSVVTMARTLDW